MVTNILVTHYGGDEIMSGSSSKLVVLYTSLVVPCAVTITYKSAHHMLRTLPRLNLLQTQIIQKPYTRSLSTSPPTAAMDKATGILSWADKKTGAFNRQTSVFRDFISNEPNAQFPAEKGRYHLYVSYACPWGTSLSSVNFRDT